MSDTTLLRIAIAFAGLILIGAIIFFGRPRKQGQGKRASPRRVPRESIADAFAPRTEPTLAGAATGNAGIVDNYDERATQAELDLAAEAAAASPVTSDLGKRSDESFEKIVTLYLAARAGARLHGPDIVVAAEKAGLSYGHMGVFHRLIDNHPERGPVFSVA